MKKIYIEISDICGLKCSFCPMSKGIRGIMNLELFKKVAFEAKQYTNLIALHILGDPLSVENLAEYLKIAKEANLKVEVTTSGANLKDFNLLLQSPIKQVNFSLDALNELENKDFLLKRIIDFCAYKRQFQNEVFVNLRVQKRARNKNLVVFLEREFEKFGAKNLMYFLGKSKGKNGYESKNTNRIKLGNKIIIDFRETFVWNIKGDFGDSYDFPQRNLRQDSQDLQQNLHNLYNDDAICGTCFALQNHIGILSNGEIVPCCMDFNGILSLGNIADLSIKSALNSHKAQEMLCAFRQNRIIEAFCKSCDYRKVFDFMLDL